MGRLEAAEVYARRRARVLEALGADGVMVLPAATELRAGRNLELRYRPDPDLYYLTGYPEPEAVLVLAPGSDAPYTLFVRPRDPAMEQWTGPRGGPEAAREVYGADEAYPLDELDSRLIPLLRGAGSIYFPLGSGNDALEALIVGVLSEARRSRQRTGRGPGALVDPGRILDGMRVVKDDHELTLLREAARVTADAFRAAARAVRPGAGEWDVEAALEHAFRTGGADGFGFATIVGSGVNGTVLHYIANSKRMEAGELVVVDAGAYRRGYNGDISRTFPVSGRFTPAQRALYDVVLDAHDRAIAAARPGVPVAEVHRTAVRALVEGTVDLGLLDGSVDEIIETEAYRALYPHQTSHWLGLDVHDVGDYAVDGEPVRLEPGMVLTIEPGLYIPPDFEAAPAELRGTGIRVEDDVVVTSDAPEILTAALPAGADEVEALVRGTA